VAFPIGQESSGNVREKYRLSMWERVRLQEEIFIAVKEDGGAVLDDLL